MMNLPLFLFIPEIYFTTGRRQFGSGLKLYVRLPFQYFNPGYQAQKFSGAS